MRAKIVLAAAQGQPNVQMAASPGDAKRSARPPMFKPVQVAQAKAAACATPADADAGLALSRWSCPELARHAVAEGICASTSPATVRRRLKDALKPWQYRSDLHHRP